MRRRRNYLPFSNSNIVKRGTVRERGCRVGGGREGEAQREREARVSRGGGGGGGEEEKLYLLLKRQHRERKGEERRRRRGRRRIKLIPPAPAPAGSGCKLCMEEERLVTRWCWMCSCTHSQCHCSFSESSRPANCLAPLHRGRGGREGGREGGEGGKGGGGRKEGKCERKSWSVCRQRGQHNSCASQTPSAPPPPSPLDRPQHGIPSSSPLLPLPRL